MSEKIKEEGKANVPVFSKEQILKSSKYSKYKDALSVILSDGKNYSLVDVDKKLNDFMKGKVN